MALVHSLEEALKAMKISEQRLEAVGTRATGPAVGGHCGLSDYVLSCLISKEELLKGTRERHLLFGWGHHHLHLVVGGCFWCFQST